MLMNVLFIGSGLWFMLCSRRYLVVLYVVKVCGRRMRVSRRLIRMRLVMILLRRFRLCRALRLLVRLILLVRRRLSLLLVLGKLVLVVCPV